MAATAKKTDPKLWERIKARVTKGAKGGDPGEWSARKAQLAVQEYKKAGGGYEGKKTEDNHLLQWEHEEWGTKSGRKSKDTGERYLPKKAREALSEDEYARTTAKKRRDTAKGKQFSAQPRDVARKAATARKGTAPKRAAGGTTKRATGATPKRAGSTAAKRATGTRAATARKAATTRKAPAARGTTARRATAAKAAPARKAPARKATGARTAAKRTTAARKTAPKATPKRATSTKRPAERKAPATRSVATRKAPARKTAPRAAAKRATTPTKRAPARATTKGKSK